MHNKINRVCIIDSAYSLLLYLIISSLDEINHTFFFVSSGINNKICKNLQCYKFMSVAEFNRQSQKKQRLELLKLKLYSRIKWSFLQYSQFFGHDHLWFSSPLIGRNKITLIEDGTANYKKWPSGIDEKNKSFKLVLRSLMYGYLSAYQKRFGNHRYCEKVILTGLNITDASQRLNSIVVSMEGCWKQANKDKQSLIYDIFNITEDDLKLLSFKSTILFTQPISEDNIMSEEDKISLYKRILSDIKSEDVIIKVHPRETTNYKQYFPNITVFDKPVPMQLLSYSGVRFKQSITISSAAALDFNYPIEKVFYGTEIDERLVEEWGIIRLTDFEK